MCDIMDDELLNWEDTSDYDIDLEKETALLNETSDNESASKNANSDSECIKFELDEEADGEDVLSVHLGEEDLLNDAAPRETDARPRTNKFSSERRHHQREPPARPGRRSDGRRAPGRQRADGWRRPRPSYQGQHRPAINSRHNGRFNGGRGRSNYQNARGDRNQWNNHKEVKSWKDPGRNHFDLKPRSLLDGVFACPSLSERERNLFPNSPTFVGSNRGSNFQQNKQNFTSPWLSNFSQPPPVEPRVEPFISPFLSNLNTNFPPPNLQYDFPPVSLPPQNHYQNTSFFPNYAQNPSPITFATHPVSNNFNTFDRQSPQIEPNFGQTRSQYDYSQSPSNTNFRTQNHSNFAPISSNFVLDDQNAFVDSSPRPAVCVEKANSFAGSQSSFGSFDKPTSSISPRKPRLTGISPNLCQIKTTDFLPSEIVSPEKVEASLSPKFSIASDSQHSSVSSIRHLPNTTEEEEQEEEDDETKLYRLKIEEQKQKRAKIIEMKEERRKLQIDADESKSSSSETQPAPQPADVPPKKKIHLNRHITIRHDTPKSTIEVTSSADGDITIRKTLVSPIRTNPNLIEIKQTPIEPNLLREPKSGDFLANRVISLKATHRPAVSCSSSRIASQTVGESEVKKCFLAGRTILRKDDKNCNISNNCNLSNIVKISNLSAGTSKDKIIELTRGIGDVQNLQMDAQERQATIQFKTVASAHSFLTKYQHYMLDLSLIQVQLEPSV